MNWVLELLIWGLVVCAPVWVLTHAVVIVRSKRPVLYFELRKLSNGGDRMAQIAFWSWVIAIGVSVVLFALVVVRVLAR